MALIIVLGCAYRLARSWWSQRAAARSGPKTARQQLAAAGQRAAEVRDVQVSGRERWISWGSYVVLAGTLISLVHWLHLGLPNVGQ